MRKSKYNTTESHADGGQNAVDALHKRTLCSLSLHVHITAHFFRFVAIIPRKLLLHQGLEVQIPYSDQLPLAGERPCDGHK